MRIRRYVGARRLRAVGQAEQILQVVEEERGFFAVGQNKEVIAAYLPGQRGGEQGVKAARNATYLKPRRLRFRALFERLRQNLYERVLNV